MGLLHIDTTDITSDKAVFNWLSKYLRGCVGYYGYCLKNLAKASEPMRSKPETLYTRFFPHLRNVRVIVRNSDFFIALFVPVVVGRVITLVLVFWLSFDTCSIYSADSWSIAWLTGLGGLISQKEICGHDLTVFCKAVSYSLSFSFLNSIQTDLNFCRSI